MSMHLLMFSVIRLMLVLPKWITRGWIMFRNHCCLSKLSLIIFGMMMLVCTMSLAVIVFVSPSFAGTTCGAPIGKVVSFKAYNDRYVTADKNIVIHGVDNPPVVANRDWVSQWEQFLVEDAGGGYIVLKALANDLYVSADFDSSDGQLFANKEKGEISDTERFFWITNTDGTISLMLKENGRYVTADLGVDVDEGNPDPDEPPLFANRPWIREWEKFTTTVTCLTAPPERLVDNGDGTITDNETGLMWEKKLAADGSEGGNCDDLDQANWNVNCVNNIYTWTDPADGDATNPDGTAFTDFLSTLNQEYTEDFNSTCFANHCDWRLPRLVELRSIRQESCSNSDCIDPIFGSTGHNIGLFPSAPYWSSTSEALFPSFALAVIFHSASTPGGVATKETQYLVRAVRGGR
jgi:hypothetical protein